MMNTQAAITRARRDLIIGTVLRMLLVAAAIACWQLTPPSGRVGGLAAVACIWVWLSFSSVRGSRLAAGSTSLIAAGEYEEAERQIDRALRSFSLFRSAKLQSLHHLAILRHAQRRWSDTVLVCRALLRHRLGRLNGLSKPARFILADALLEMDDMQGAYEALQGLSRQRLSLGEVLNLLVLQLDYQARVGAWTQMFSQVMNKVQLAELMPSSGAARVQSFLALAAARLGRDDWVRWLRSRVELLAEPKRLIRERPILRAVWRS